MTQAAVATDLSSHETHAGKNGKQKLSREVIEHAAITVARTEGFSALSIRNVAKVLGVAPMALYTHVKNKEELAEHVADSLVGGIDTRTQPGVTWQDKVRAMLRSHRDLILKHPEIMPYIASASSHPGPGLARFTQAMVTVLTQAGFERNVAQELYFVLMTYNYGSSVTARANGSGPNNLLQYNDGLTTIFKSYETRVSRPALGLVDSMRERLRLKKK